MTLVGIGERLKTIRGSESLSAFADKIAVSKSTLTRYESERSYPDAKLIWKICCLFSINPNWLLIGEGPFKKVDPPLGYNEAHNRLRARIDDYGIQFIHRLGNKEIFDTILSDGEITKIRQDRIERMVNEDVEDLPVIYTWGFEKARDVTFAYTRGNYLPSDVELWAMCKTAHFDDFEALRTGRDIGTQLDKEITEGFVRQKIAVTDTKLLKIILETTEQIQQEHDAALAIEKKAEIISILYEEVSTNATGLALLPERADRLFKLAL